jgi:beta-glucosidase
MKLKGINSYQFRRLLSFLIAFVFAVGIVFTGIPQSAYAQHSLPTYLDPTAAVEDRVDDLLGRMTLDEKVGQMLQPEKGSISIDDVKNYYLGSVLSGGGSFPGSGAEVDSTMEKWSSLYDSMQDGALSTRLGIPLLYGVDAVHGHSNVKGATIFPHSIGLGATRDLKLVKKVGAAVAKEVKATGVNWTFAPTIVDPQNIKWGRTYEGFGDNLNLVADMGVAYIQGLQGDDINDLKQSEKVVATVKHYIGEGWTDNGTNQGNVTTMTK